MIQFVILGLLASVSLHSAALLIAGHVASPVRHSDSILKRKPVSSQKHDGTHVSLIQTKYELSHRRLPDRSSYLPMKTVGAIRLGPCLSKRAHGGSPASGLSGF